MEHVFARLAMTLGWRRQDTGQVGKMWRQLRVCPVCVCGVSPGEAAVILRRFLLLAPACAGMGGPQVKEHQGRAGSVGAHRAPHCPGEQLQKGPDPLPGLPRWQHGSVPTLLSSSPHTALGRGGDGGAWGDPREHRPLAAALT